jgi:hypothetical protein
MSARQGTSQRCTERFPKPCVAGSNPAGGAKADQRIRGSVLADFEGHPGKTGRADHLRARPCAASCASHSESAGRWSPASERALDRQAAIALGDFHLGSKANAYVRTRVSVARVPRLSGVWLWRDVRCLSDQVDQQVPILSQVRFGEPNVTADDAHGRGGRTGQSNPRRRVRC